MKVGGINGIESGTELEPQGDSQHWASAYVITNPYNKQGRNYHSCLTVENTEAWRKEDTSPNAYDYKVPKLALECRSVCLQFLDCVTGL